MTRRQPIGPDCRDGKHQGCAGQALDEQADEVVACTCCQTHDAVTLAPKIEVWETEVPDLVIFGTHDRTEALVAALRFYAEDVGEVPDGLADIVHDTVARWSDPAVKDEELWPAESVSKDPVAGWTPFLVVGL